METAQVAGFDAIFGTHRGTSHDPLVEAALTRIPALTNHLLVKDGRAPRREDVRLILREACLELEKHPVSERRSLPILIMLGAPEDFLGEAITISVKEWLSRGNGYAGWKAAVELVRDERVDDASGLHFADNTHSLDSLDTRAIVEQVAHALVYDWEWTREAIGQSSLAKVADSWRSPASL